MIKVNDPIYGTFELPELFEDLLASTAVQRLGSVHHSGAIFLVNPDISHTRLEHSIGVMLLIRILGGSELEQIAGLLHDISHTAFSHVGDYVFDNKEENYHEQLFESLLINSDVPAILEKHGYHSGQILNGGFSILEQPLPYLCADRLDYTLRDATYAELITRQDARSFMTSVTLQEDKIVVKDEEHAQWINLIFEKLNKEVYNAPLYIYANQQLALLIRDFLKTGQLKETDLLKDDTYLLNKLRSTTYGYDAIKAIKLQKGYQEFLRKGASLKIKQRRLQAPVLAMEKNKY
jgi:HD superfamily phosphohydrolase